MSGLLAQGKARALPWTRWGQGPQTPESAPLHFQTRTGSKDLSLAGVQGAEPPCLPYYAGARACS